MFHQGLVRRKRRNSDCCGICLQSRPYFAFIRDVKEMRYINIKHNRAPEKDFAKQKIFREKERQA